MFPTYSLQKSREAILNFVKPYRGISASYHGTLLRSSISMLMFLVEYEIVLSLVELIPLSCAMLSSWHVSRVPFLSLLHVKLVLSLTHVSSGSQTSLYSWHVVTPHVEVVTVFPTVFSASVAVLLLFRNLFVAWRRSSADLEDIIRLLTFTRFSVWAWKICFRINNI